MVLFLDFCFENRVLPVIVIAHAHNLSTQKQRQRDPEVILAWASDTLSETTNKENTEPIVVIIHVRRHLWSILNRL